MSKDGKKMVKFLDNMMGCEKGFTYRYKCKECGTEHFKFGLCPAKKCDGLCVLKDGMRPMESKGTGWAGSKGRMW